MTDEDALLAAICANPADNLARMVFADYLQDQGGKVEIAWAAFIRGTVREAQGQVQALDATRVRMFSSHFWLKQFAERLGAPADIIDRNSWERGFPRSVSGEYEVVRPVWAKLIERAPIQHLTFRIINIDGVEEFIQWPRLDRLRSLELSAWDINADPVTLSERGITALTACARLASLESLTLGYVHVNELVADLILDSPHLAKLRSLRMFQQGFSSSAAINRLRERFGRYSVY